jgi:hypothetical protein
VNFGKSFAGGKISFYRSDMVGWLVEGHEARYALLASRVCDSRVSMCFRASPHADNIRSITGELRPTTIHIREAVTITPSTGYSKVIKADSTWQLAGSVPHGEVYRPIGDVFAVEGANVHEAYLVVNQGQVVGFYLPGEGAFAPLPGRIPLPVK